MSQSLNPIRYEWKDIPWKQIQVKVFKLQRRIYRALQSGDVKRVHRLQRLLMKSWYAKCLAVRRVTQDNQGKKTAGVDGVKSLTPAQRFQLINSMDFKSKSRAVRRVWIPKPGKAEKRPLGIPTLHDRALQALLKMALEPEWEGKFEPNSYGFRPGRSAHDAIAAIFTAIAQKSKFVLDADIAQCFDKISHEELLRKMNTFSLAGRVIRGWLKAGVMDGGNLFPTSEGTPQGGVISPLLANIALHGLETFVLNQFPEKKNGQNWKPQFVRYADDFVVLHHDLEVIQQCQTLISEWLTVLGLELKPSKTRIAHTLNPVEEQKPGFDFLGFNIRSYPVGKTHSGKNNGKLTGFQTFIKPSKANIKAQYHKIAEHIESLKAAPQKRMISDLNPAIRGWSNYYSAVVSSAI
jgi:RNA-directed DNA polymerase